MNKKIAALMILSFTLFTAACSDDNTRKETTSGYKFSNTSYKNYKNDNNTMGTDRRYGDFGYVRHEYKGENRKPLSANQIPKMDRQKLADMITDMAVRLPNIKDMAVLVTDEEVLMAYETTSKNRMAMADNVKKTAFSVVPRYYHVYVSDKKGMIGKLEQYRSINYDTENAEGIIDRLIAQMKKSPQGYKVSDGENQNGEMKGEMNSPMNK
ncbi:YhcN/YlaJ family sporulation lipoprotein [Fictibacillus sp. KIGAM418]|uniref:YhcN/YlaJ family sporulation lipoprotein n=1 Tax=Fictibacillus marinisediminis TaxID=2878389 RepID=A0A9X1XDZ0_9BACL|nr:YhcN/YlaJ family sporulation lipoprotein [Fictibacillus marinisediminis]MCK6258346.1 YhcN/YlaJ family sporulation lipoprotein [Fictibacillus marinisediminis]